MTVVVDQRGNPTKNTGKLYLAPSSWSDQGLHTYETVKLLIKWWPRNYLFKGALAVAIPHPHTAIPGTHVIFVEILQRAFSLR